MGAQLSTTAATDDAPARARSKRVKTPTIAIEGTVPYYERHMVIVESQVTADHWPKKLELSNHVVAAYSKAIGALEEAQGKELHVRVTAAHAYPTTITCGASSDDETIEPPLPDTHDVLIFPDNVRLHDVATEQIGELAAKVAATNALTSVKDALTDLNVQHSSLKDEMHLLVCAHTKRDFRCGCSGPKMLEWLHDLGKEQQLPLKLWASSHYGGHRYAGNCVVYPSGDWFGLINSPEQAAAMARAVLDEQPLRLAQHWRGRVLTTKEEQISMLKDAEETR
ncbi:TPA: hypothetical protein N0F65_007379 [Lagenidium giganteum]|uniref:Sucrase n=1 Tax=Lagenidium giganteum TaxID=4803 RepID=A0AAV2YHH1_9STRA|nr:TPA: hypothetical protein N0F65_007379 [Lagenidium giganteum]